MVDKQTRQKGNHLRLKRLLKALTTLRFPSIFTADCPHCDTGSTSFTILGEPRQSMGGQARYTFGICGSCKGGVVLEIVLVSLEGDVDVTARAIPRPMMGTKRITEVRVPTCMPPKVESFFRQARHNLVLKNWDAAGVMYRKALEIGLTSILGKTKGNLASDIGQAVKKVGVPPDFKGSAEIIRIVGNEAAHEEEFSEFEARLLDADTEAVLVCLFTIPGILKEACAKW